jgi:DNA-binding transcriptional LysR family regulator
MIEPLTLDQLRVLVAVAEAGSFSAASRQLRRVQSAVSQCIQALENTLQLQLFDRSGKWPKLTEAGQAVVSDARRLLRGAEALRSRAGSMVDGLEPALSLAIDPLFPWMPMLAPPATGNSLLQIQTSVQRSPIGRCATPRAPHPPVARTLPQ